MKVLKLTKNQKFEIHLDEIKDTNFLDSYAKILQKCLKVEPGLQLDVSKIWCNESTYEIFKSKLLKQLEKKLRNKGEAKRKLSWVLLQYAPAVDIYDEFHIPNNFFFVEDDCLVKPREEDNESNF